jgi:hypothetical protein
MSESTAAVAAPATAALANAAETPVNTTDTAALDAVDAADEAAEAAIDPKATKPAVQKAKETEKRLKKLKLKVDGKEIEEEIDLDDDERLIRELQMSKMGQKRAQDHANLEKQVKAFFQDFEKDPFAAMKNLGMSPDQVIDKYINEQLENAKKSPEQLEAEKAKAELQALKAEREKEREDNKAKELARLQEQAFQQYDMQMEQSLSKSDLPKTPYTVKKIADYMLVALQAGKDVTPDDVIPLVREEMHNDIKEMFASLPEDIVEGLLGEQVLTKLRKRRVAKAAAAQAVVGKPNITDTGKSAKTESKSDGKKVDFKTFFGI